MPVALTPVDDALATALATERDRQRETLSLTASENQAGDAVLVPEGPVLTNEYAEHVAVRPHSDTEAYLAASRTLLSSGDRILSLEMAHGGHLGHGQPHTAVAERFDAGGTTVELSRMRVDPDSRGQGYGTRVYEALESRARDAGYRAFVLNTGVDNDRARGFYEGRGFDAVDEVIVDFGDVVLELALYCRGIG